jgi:hypothetical protein
MDFRQIRGGLRIAAIGAVLLFIFLFFFDWYTIGGTLGALVEKAGVSKPTVNGWHSHSILRWFMLLTIIGTVTLAYLAAAGRKLSMAVSPTAILTALSGITAICLAYRVIINNPGPDSVITTKIGAWLGLISLITVAVGGFLAMREEGVSFSDAGDQVRDAMSGVSKPEAAAATATPAAAAPAPGEPAAPVEEPPATEEPPAASPA